MEENSLFAIQNEFFAGLFISVLDLLDQTVYDRLFKDLSLQLELYFRTILQYQEYKWIQSCLKHKISLKQVFAAFRFGSMLKKLDDEKLIAQNLIKFCMQMLNLCGTEFCGSSKKPTSVSEFISLLVSNLLNDLFLLDLSLGNILFRKLLGSILESSSEKCAIFIGKKTSFFLTCRIFFGYSHLLNLRSNRELTKSVC
jgi:hypothetical protein